MKKYAAFGQMDNGRDTGQFPCVRKCCLNEEDVCLGCFRTLQEICRWSEAGDEERRAILENARERKAAWQRKVGDHFAGDPG